MAEDVQLLKQQNEQRETAKKEVAARATFDDLKAKRLREAEVEAEIEPGNPVSFLFRAISGPRYDELILEFPPTDKQKKDDPAANVNGDLFSPALLAEVCAEPKLTREQWGEIWALDTWTGAEKGSLYWQAYSLCQRPLDLTPFDRG